MKDLTELGTSRGMKVFRKILSSKYLPFLTSAVVLTCYYLALDLVMMYYVAALGILMLLFLDDLTPLICQIPFLHVLISRQNSPSSTVGGSEYYFQTAVTVQIAILIALFVGMIIYRIIMLGVQKKFRFSPVFFGLCALALAFLFNGVKKDYNPMNLAYGLFMAFFFLGIFVLIKDNFKANKENFAKIAVGLIALSVVLVVELAVAYLKLGVVTNGTINRDKLMFGWGIYNNLGMLIVLCIPAATYLAGRYRYGFAFTLYAFVLFLAAFFSASRQAMLGAVFIFPVCAIILLVKGKNRIANSLILGAALIGLIIIAGLKQDSLYAFFKRIFSNVVVNGELNGSSRWQIWHTGIDNFVSAPVFGVGFYVDIPNVAEFVGLDIIPLMYHNTFIQMLAACGIVGLAAYLVHRIQTIICYFKNITMERTFIAVAVLSMLLISLLDNHLFYIFPTMIYSSLIAVLVRTVKKTY